MHSRDPSAGDHGASFLERLSRNWNFWILVADIGHSVTNRTCRGTLNRAILPAHQAINSSGVAATTSGLSSTKATGTSS